jgi:hypothetical protein
MTDTSAADYKEKPLSDYVHVDARQHFDQWCAGHKLDIETTDRLWEMQRSKAVLPDQLTAREPKATVEAYAACMLETFQQAKAAAKAEPTVSAPMIEAIELEDLAFGDKGGTTRMKNRATLRAHYINELGLSVHDADAKLAATAEEWGASLGTLTPGKPPRRVELLRAAQMRDFTGQGTGGGGTVQPDTKSKDASGHGTTNTDDTSGDDAGEKNPWHPSGIDKALGRYSNAAIKRQADFVRLAGVAKANAVAAKFNRKVGDMK